MEDRADVESAQSEGWRTCVEFNVAGQKNKQKKKETAEAKGAWASEQQGGGESGTVEVGVLLAGGVIWWVMSWPARVAEKNVVDQSRNAEATKRTKE